MKKHEALTKAMADYPDGTFVWIGDEKTQLKMPYTFGTTAIHDINYNSIYEMSTGYWFEKVEEEKTKKLEGKIAVRFDNQQQLDIVCKHFNIKMSTTYDRIINTNGNIKPFLFTDREFTFDSFHYAKGSGYKCITFDTFVKELDITVPKFVIRSEDEVNMYEGDKFHEARFTDGKWTYLGGDGWVMGFPVASFTNPTMSKAFSTKEAAEAWIKQQNKPKEIRLSDKKGLDYALVDVNGFRAYINTYDSEQLEEIYKAHQSFKS